MTLEQLKTASRFEMVSLLAATFEEADLNGLSDEGLRTACWLALTSRQWLEAAGVIPTQDGQCFCDTCLAAEIADWDPLGPMR